MKKAVFRLACLVIMGLFLGFSPLKAQSSYPNYDALTARLHQLEAKYKNLTQLKSLGKTATGKDIWALTIGSGDTENHPAIAVIGGVKGSHIFGSELALTFAEKLLAEASTDSIRQLLGTTAFYVLPRINPDATEQYFASLSYERDVNTTSTNDDNDDAFEEDGPEDLNGDHLITMIRVKDETGAWMPMPDEPRLLKKADITKGEKGMYRIYIEGRDNDDDGQLNEDGSGGVNINKNFTYKYPNFEPGAGLNMASQPETRAVLDFLYEGTPNVYAVVSFGPENNLSTPVKFSKSAVSKRVVSGWYKDDVAINQLVSDAYNDALNMKNAPKAPGQGGDLFQWAYFHYGRFSFSTPGWWTPEVKDENGKTTKFENDDARFLAWADQQNLDVFVNWEKIDHPDFPDKTVEVGGIKPFVSYNPPYEMVDSLSQKHTDFLVKLASMKPQIKLANFEARQAGKNLTRVSVDIHNAGTFPTASKLGARNDWMKPMVVRLKLSKKLNIVSGKVMETIDRIDGDGTVHKTWLLRGKGSFSLSVGTSNTGISTIEHTIK
jgi:hypothetical protein